MRIEEMFFFHFLFSKETHALSSLSLFLSPRSFLSLYKNQNRITEEVTDDDEEGGDAPPSKRAKRSSAAEEEEEDEEDEEVS